jgi:membrane protease YdiL (CAAX protease family)
MKTFKQNPIRFILLFYAVCFVFRGIEYLVIRTDQSFIGEAFIHKLIGIALLAAAVWLIEYKWRDIGFTANNMIRNLFAGLLLGVVVFSVAYGTELIIHAAADNAPSLRFYVTSYAIQGSRAMQDGLLFFLICVIGNIINVIMEEGVFRGLFVRLTEERHSFFKATVISSVLFGFWHLAQPVRNILDGEQSIPGAVMMGLMLVVTSALLGVQYCMLYKITGSLWAGMAAHFINNASSNLLHVETISGIDELLTIRISVAQTLSFVIVLVLFLRHRRLKQTTT